MSVKPCWTWRSNCSYDTYRLNGTRIEFNQDKTSVIITSCSRTNYCFAHDHEQHIYNLLLLFSETVTDLNVVGYLEHEKFPHLEEQIMRAIGKIAWSSLEVIKFYHVKPSNFSNIITPKLISIYFYFVLSDEQFIQALSRVSKVREIHVRIEHHQEKQLAKALENNLDLEHISIGRDLYRGPNDKQWIDLYRTCPKLIDEFNIAPRVRSRDVRGFWAFLELRNGFAKRDGDFAIRCRVAKFLCPFP